MAKASGKPGGKSGGKARRMPPKGVETRRAEPRHGKARGTGKATKARKGSEAGGPTPSAASFGWRGRLWPFRKGTTPVAGAPSARPATSASPAVPAKTHRTAVLLEAHDDHLPEPETEAVVLRWRKTNAPNGTDRASQALAAALRAGGVLVRESHPFYRELRLGKRRFGGRVSLAIGSRLPRWSKWVVHATQPGDSPPFVAADVVTVHDVTPVVRPDLDALGRLGARKRKRQVRRALRRGLVVTLTEHGRSELLAAFPKHARADRIAVVPNGIDHRAFHPGEPDTRWLRNVLRIGFLNVACVMDAERRKRIDVLAEAAAASPYVNLVHVGTQRAPKAHREPLERAQVALRHMAKEGRYHALGALPDPMLRDVLSQADLVVHASEAEGFGLPPLEALACGAPVLASDIPAHREVLGDAARYFALDARALADEFDRAWTGVTPTLEHFPPREARLARAAQFTWTRAADAHRDVYRGIGKPSAFAGLRRRR